MDIKFLNENDREIYEMLDIICHGTSDNLLDWLNSHPIPENKKNNLIVEEFKCKSREEQINIVIATLEKLMDHINKTYFKGA